MSTTLQRVSALELVASGGLSAEQAAWEIGHWFVSHTVYLAASTAAGRPTRLAPSEFRAGSSGSAAVQYESTRTETRIFRSIYTPPDDPEAVGVLAAAKADPTAENVRAATTVAQPCYSRQIIARVPWSSVEAVLAPALTPNVCAAIEALNAERSAFHAREPLPHEWKRPADRTPAEVAEWCARDNEITEIDARCRVMAAEVWELARPAQDTLF